MAKMKEDPVFLQLHEATSRDTLARRSRRVAGLIVISFPWAASALEARTSTTGFRPTFRDPPDSVRSRLGDENLSHVDGVEGPV